MTIDIFSIFHDFWWAFVAAIALGLLGFFVRKWLPDRSVASGRWAASFTAKDGSKVEETINLKCRFGYVWGDVESRWKEGDTDVVVSYSARGLSKGSTVVAAYLAKEPGNYDMGVLIVRILPSGRIANGIVTSYDSPTTHDHFDFGNLDSAQDYHWSKVIS